MRRTSGNSRFQLAPWAGKAEGHLCPIELMTELLKGGKRKNKTRGNGRKGKIGGGLSLPLKWALVWELNWGRQILGQWDETGGMGGTKKTASVELVMLSVYIASTPYVGTIYYGQEDYRK